MESLVLLVAVLFFMALFSGPIAIGLTSALITNAFEDKKGIGRTLFNIVRKTLHLLLAGLGMVVGIQFLFLANLPLIPRTIGLFSIVTSYIAVRREYFAETYIVSKLLGRLGVGNKSNDSQK